MAGDNFLPTSFTSEAKGAVSQVFVRCDGTCMSRGERVSDERAGEATETRSITRRERENFTSMSSDIKEKKKTIRT